MADSFEVDFLTTYDEESILEELRRLAAALDKPNVSAMDLAEYGRVKYQAVIRRFGSLRHALERAGLRPSRCMNMSDEDILALLAKLWRMTLRDHGRRPRVADLATYQIAISAHTLTKRFGSWKKALVATAEMAKGKSWAGTRTYPASRSIPVGKRFLVLKRARYRCQICHRSGVELEVDHIVPVSLGGSDGMDNLQAACLACNRGKGNQRL